MKKEHWYGMSYAPYAKDIDDNLVESEIKDDDIVSDVKAEDSLLSIVYARDERTA